MYKNVFFSFHYDDVWMVNQIRNSNVIKGIKVSGYKDKAEFEKLKLTGDKAVKDWIDEQISGTSVTAVLIGKETLKRPYVQYEIQESVRKGNKIIGITLEGMNDSQQKSYQSICDTNTIIGYIDGTKQKVTFWEVASDIYSYKKDDGYHNLGKWVADTSQSKIRLNLPSEPLKFTDVAELFKK